MLVNLQMNILWQCCLLIRCFSRCQSPPQGWVISANKYFKLNWEVSGTSESSLSAVVRTSSPNSQLCVTQFHYDRNLLTLSYEQFSMPLSTAKDCIFMMHY